MYFSNSYWNTSELFSVDWSKDGYRWRDRGSIACYFSDSECVGKKLYYHIITGTKYEYTKGGRRKLVYLTSKQFTRIVFFHPMFSSVFISYNGDEKLAGHFPHGNSKLLPKCARPFISSAPSTIKRLRAETGTPGIIYKTLLSQAP